MKVPVCIRDKYVLYLEWCQNYLWFHTDVFEWDKTIKKSFVEDLNKVQSLLPLPLLALVKEEDKKLHKFGKVLGWTPTNQINLNDGSKATIYSWSK